MRPRPLLALAYGVACHGLFLAAVGVMAWSLYLGLQPGLGSLHAVSPALGWLANLLLLAQFPLLHSWLLTPAGHRVLQALAPPSVAGEMVTTSYVILSSLQLLATFLLWSPTGVVWWEAQGLLRVGLTVLFVIAWLLLGASMRDAGLGVQLGYLGWLSVWRGVKPQYPPMPDHGLFKHTRQPIYLSFALTLWTSPTWTPDLLLVAVLWTAYCVLGPLHKERRSARIFKERFHAYRRRVPYFLPRLWTPATPPQPEAKSPQEGP